MECRGLAVQSPLVNDRLTLHRDSYHAVDYPHHAQCLGRHRGCNQLLATSPRLLFQVGLQSCQITSSTMASASGKRSLPEIRRGRRVSRRAARLFDCSALERMRCINGSVVVSKASIALWFSGYAIEIPLSVARVIVEKTEPCACWRSRFTNCRVL